MCACEDRGGGHQVSCFTILFLTPVSLFSEHFQIAGCPASSNDPPVSVQSSAEVTVYGCPAMFFTWVLGNPSIGLPAGIAKALPTELSPQPVVRFKGTKCRFGWTIGLLRLNNQ